MGCKPGQQVVWHVKTGRGLCQMGRTAGLVADSFSERLLGLGLRLVLALLRAGWCCWRPEIERLGSDWAGLLVR